MTDLEAEFARRWRAREVRGKDGRAILVHVGEKSERDGPRKARESVRELRELARTAGWRSCGSTSWSSGSRPPSSHRRRARPRRRPGRAGPPSPP
jgi:hypothetical protein